MLVLALKSVRYRPGRFLSTLLAAFLGATVVMVFASLHDTAAQPGIAPQSADSLGTAASVVGGYGALLVFFAIASTLTVNVRQRASELRLLRCSGATPAQLAGMVVGEAVAVALAGGLLAIGPAMAGGRALLGVFQDNGQVPHDVGYRFGPVALLSGTGITLVAAAGAAFLTVRRATRPGAEQGRARTVLACAALAGGAGSVLSTYAFPATDEWLMAGPAYGAILLSVGCALLAPLLLRGLLKRLPVDGASGWLAVRTVRRRADHLAGILTSLVLFTAVATVTLYAQTVETDALTATGTVRSLDAKTLQSVNLAVVGIVVVFVCLMLVNSLYAATSYRGREFGQQRLAGATPGQVLATVAAEGVMVTATGVLLGSLAALAGIIPFTMVRAGKVLPSGGLGIWLAVVAVATAATLGTSLLTARQVVRQPAIQAVAAA